MLWLDTCEVGDKTPRATRRLQFTDTGEPVPATTAVFSQYGRDAGRGTRTEDQDEKQQL